MHRQRRRPGDSHTSQSRWGCTTNQALGSHGNPTGTICLHSFPTASYYSKAKTVPCRNLLLALWSTLHLLNPYPSKKKKLLNIYPSKPVLRDMALPSSGSSVALSTVWKMIHLSESCTGRSWSTAFVIFKKNHLKGSTKSFSPQVSSQEAFLWTEMAEWGTFPG